MKYIRSNDVSDITNEVSERGQGITNFEYSNGFLYYENFSVTRFFGKTTGNGTKQLIKTNDLFTMVTEATNNTETKAFYHLSAKEIMPYTCTI